MSGLISQRTPGRTLDLKSDLPRQKEDFTRLGRAFHFKQSGKTYARTELFSV
jgi:hypothetical protein